MYPSESSNILQTFFSSEDEGSVESTIRKLNFECTLYGPSCAQLLHDAVAAWLNNDFVNCWHTSERCLDFCWERLHVGDWKSVSLVWREAYAAACILSSLGALERNDHVTSMKLIDMGLMLGDDTHSDTLHAMAGYVSQSAHHSYTSPETCLVDDAHCPGTPLFGQSDYCVTRMKVPTLMRFYTEFYQQRIPIVITDGIAFWPAMDRSGSRSWNNLSYLIRQAGLRTVPVEVGTTYMEASWSQTMMRFDEFVKDYLMDAASCFSSTATEEKRPIAYLAQHELFDQIPVLRKDISVPDYCSLGDGDVKAINAWFGPANTVSPLHQDPYHNLLAQVVGWKYIRLYSPTHSSKLYPHIDEIHFNTSMVDIERPDPIKFPKFSEAPYLECVIGPGDMLYIPPKWWHFVKSLSVSISVSFWWT
eukprot:Rmarinus@m.2610